MGDAVASDRAVVTAASAGDRSIPRAAIRLLIVDDEESQAAVMALPLKREGMQPQWTRVATVEALRDALKESYDVALVDWKVPGMRPEDTVRMIKEADPTLPIIAVSGHVPESELASLLRLGCDDFMSKDSQDRLPHSIQLLMAERQRRAELQRVERARRIAETRYRALFEHADDGVILVDAASATILDANPTAADMLDCDLQDIVGRGAAAVLPGLVQSEVQRCLEEVLGTAANGCEKRDLHLDHRIHGTMDVEMSISLIKAEGVDPFVQIILRNVTDRKQLERQLQAQAEHLQELVDARTEELRVANEELRERNVQLVAANEAKNRFLQNMHHELKTPLGSIIGPAEALLADDPRPDQARTLKQIAEAGKQLLRFIDDLLSLVEIESRSLQPHITNVFVKDLLEKVTTVLQWQIERRGLHFETSVDPSIRALRADPRRMEQVLTNLLTNAIKFTPEGGRVSVTVQCLGDGHVRLSVQDNGMGISEKDLPHIFDRFYRAEEARRLAIRGAGIGLSLVKDMVELQGGRIEVESQQGVGTTVSIILPAICRPPNVTPATAVSPSMDGAVQ